MLSGNPSMKPLSTLSTAIRRDVRGVFFDIDDTLTTDGRLTAQAYGALEDLAAAGILTVPITGRPAGWCDHIARMWPVDGVVGENGAFYFVYDRGGRKMQRRFLSSDEQRRDARKKPFSRRCREALSRPISTIGKPISPSIFARM
jgi:hypothetical protein